MVFIENTRTTVFQLPLVDTYLIEVSKMSSKIIFSFLQSSGFIGFSSYLLLRENFRLAEFSVEHP